MLCCNSKWVYVFGEDILKYWLYMNLSKMLVNKSYRLNIRNPANHIKFAKKYQFENI